MARCNRTQLIAVVFLNAVVSMLPLATTQRSQLVSVDAASSLTNSMTTPETGDEYATDAEDYEEEDDDEAAATAVDTGIDYKFSLLYRNMTSLTCNR